MGLGLRRRLEAVASRHESVRRLLTRSHLVSTGLFSRRHRHPVDRHYGIETQTPVPLYLLKTGSAADDHMIPYAGCVPSALRRVLDALPAVNGATFIDLGCGKGRALAVASEYPFARIMGIELNPDLVSVAARNLRRVARAYPIRPPMAVREGDASVPALPEGDAVIFLYHPFGASLVGRLADHLAALAGDGRTLHVVYENPVHGLVFDRHVAFARVSADMFDCAPDERPFAFDPAEAIAVWRIGCPSDRNDAMRPIVVTKPGFRAIIGQSGSAE